MTSKPNTPDTTELLLKKSTFVLILKVAGYFCAYLTTFMIARWYSAETLGIFSLSFTIISMGAILGKFGLDTLCLKQASKYFRDKLFYLKDIYVKSIGISLAFSIFIGVVLFVFSDVIAYKVFSKSYLGIYFKIISISIVPFSILYIHSECLRGIDNISYFIFFKDVGPFLLTALILPVVFILSKSEKFVLISFSISVFLCSIWSTCIWWAKSGIAKTKRQKYSSSLDLIRQAFPLLISNAIIILLGWTDVFMMGIFRPDKEVGIYTATLKLGGLISVPLIVITTITASKFRRYFVADDWHSLQSLLDWCARMLFYVSVPAFLIVVIWSKYFLWIFGKEFISGIYALKIIAFSHLINSLSGPVGYLLMMTDREIVFRNIMILSVFMNIVSNLLLIPKYGYNGAALASAISLIIPNVMCVVFIRRNLKIITTPTIESIFWRKNPTTT